MDNYEAIKAEFIALRGIELGRIETPQKTYPLFQLKQGIGPTIILSAAVHGDEPAGVYSILEFFSKYIQKYKSFFEFIAFPCVNPYGFDHFTRGNYQGLNLNREFHKDSESKETQLIMDSLEECLFAMDFHETWTDATQQTAIGEIGKDEPEGEDPREFYLWELREDPLMRVGHQIVKNIESAGLSVCKWPNIYGDTNSEGVIFYPEGCGSTCYKQAKTFDAFMAKNYTKQAFTIETPRDWNLDDRIKAHIISLTTVLDRFL